MLGTLGGHELLLIFVIALIVFGPRKLPEIGKSLGRMMAEFRKASTEFRQTIENEIETDKLKQAMSETPKVDDPKPLHAPSVEPAEASVSRDVAPPPIEPK